jgi:hypothetical protein
MVPADDLHVDDVVDVDRVEVRALDRSRVGRNETHTQLLVPETLPGHGQTDVGEFLSDDLRRNHREGVAVDVQQPTALFGVELDVFRRDVEVGGSLVPRQDVRSLPVIQKLSS